MGKVVPVKERDLLQVLAWIRDLRLRSFKKRINPWALRQGLLLALYLDTKAALERGVTPKDLEAFDDLVKENAGNIL